MISTSSKNIKLAQLGLAGILISLAFSFSTAQTATPAPSHAMLFGYYHVNAQYGDYFGEVAAYTNTQIILQESFLRADLNEADKLKNAFKQAADANKGIVFAPSNNYPGGLNSGITMAKDYWDKISMIILADEPGWDKARAEQEIGSFKSFISGQGLAQKPIAINFTPAQILTGTGFQANNLDIVGTEAYMDPSQQNAPNLIVQLNQHMADLKARIGSRKMFWVMQGYNRNGSWTNNTSLASIQMPVYLNSYNDPNVVGIFIFSYARSGGSRGNNALITEHKKIGAALLGTQSPVPVGLICDPLPDDPDQILECNFNEIFNPQPREYPPAGNPSDPVKVPLMGGFGISGAYSESNGKILIVAGDSNINGHEGTIRGAIVDATTFAIESGPFVIDQGPRTSFAGNPLAVYDSDKKRFLVIWGDARNTGTTPYLYGRFLSTTGTPEGADFKIGNVRLAIGTINDFVYDEKNKNFAVMAEEGNNRNVIDTIDANGQFVKEIVVPVSGDYAGQGSLSVNSNLNQYWTSLFDCTGSDARNEDCRVYLYKFDIATSNQVGERVQLSTARPGHNYFATSSIEYSPEDSKALAIWLERARPEGDAIYGASISDDGTVSPAAAVMDTTIDPFLSGFGSGGPVQMHYNPWTHTFMITTGIGTGESVLIETDSSGYVLQVYDALNNPVAMKNNLHGLFSWVIKQAQARAYGNFNSNNIVTPNGALALSSQNYTQLVFTNQQSLFTNSPTTPTPTPVPQPSTPPDLEGFPKLISQIYIWSLGIAALLALLMTVVGAYKYMTAAGNAESAQKGSEMIWGAIIGLALLFGAYLLLNTINPDLVNFRIGSELFK